MIKAIKDMIDFSGVESTNINKSIFFGVIVGIGRMIEMAGIYFIITAIITAVGGRAPAWQAFLIVLLGVLVACFAKGHSQMEQTHAGYFMAANKRIAIADHIKTIPMGYFNENSLGELVGTMTTVIENIETLAPMVMVRLMDGLITSFVMLACVFIFDFRFGLTMLIVEGVYLIISSRMEKKSQAVAPLRQDSEVKLVSAVLEWVQGMSIVKSFNLTGRGDKTIAEALEYNRDSNTKLEALYVPYTISQKIVLQIGTFALILESVIFYLNGTLSLAYTLMMIIMSFMVFAHIGSAGSAMAILRLLTASMEKANKPESIAKMDDAGEGYNSLKHDIEFKNVNFSYEKKQVLKDISFTIPDKTSTAIVGTSGSGKTTICNLISRFWDVDSGEVTMGGKNIKDYTLEALMSQISMVFQNVYLFADTIENNIKFGSPNATHEDVVRAAKEAACDDFIESLPDGYNTIIGEGGASLSGGERQRISIARAILKDSPVIILDEATANVDPENEDRLQKAIAKLTENKTIIMIAHRLKTVRGADQILVVDDGRIVDRGNHEELVAKEGLYRRFILGREEAENWKI
ncbi:ABC transporter ATP-binding protein [Lachnospira pectinoschiza]|uniref:ATP-binding cassette, subfamily B n=1 Tax=Lachnospira pectinoschiza TaxID=28052 RepID=A0A1G9SZC0_9FIRM|nr:ABC transporter ATP-binding protein [Lachnospira pectinoschiza]SDM40732.1 ATP-binding cassette, subfamily B [Lachnospira pectinoschiza]